MKRQRENRTDWEIKELLDLCDCYVKESFNNSWKVIQAKYSSQLLGGRDNSSIGAKASQIGLAKLKTVEDVEKLKKDISAGKYVRSVCIIFLYSCLLSDIIVCNISRAI